MSATPIPARGRRITFATAMYEALRDTMREDPRFTIFGNWVFGLQANHLMEALREEFPGRIMEPPVAEAALVATAVGAGMVGASTFVDLGTGTFSFPAWSSIYNEASVVHHLSNGQLNARLTMHMMHGLRGGGGEQHSYSPQSLLWNCPGLEIVIPSTPYDAKGLMRRALKSPNPTVFIDNTRLSATEGEVPEEDYEIPFGLADIKRAGRDVTLVATSRLVHMALGAAATLATEGIEVEVVDPRTLEPFDENTILGSVARTGRFAVLDECNLRCGVGAEIVATVAGKAFASLKAAPLRLVRAQSPVACSAPLEAALLPDEPQVVAALRALAQTGR